MIIRSIIIGKNILLIAGFVFILLSFNKWDGTISQYGRVEIYAGTTTFGTKSLKLTEEGLLLRFSDWQRANENVKFIKLHELNRNSLYSVQNYLIRMNFFRDFDTIINNDYSDNGAISNVFVIRQNNNYIKKIKSYKNDFTPLDSLVFYMNNLIPKKYKEKYSVHLSEKYTQQ